MRAARKQTTSTLLTAALTFAALAFTTLVLLGVSATLGDTRLLLLTEPLNWLAGLNDAEVFDTLSNAAEVVAAVLAIAITVVAIVVELAATRYSHLITRLFVGEPTNIVVLGLLVITSLQCMWAAAFLAETAGDALVPQAGFAITMSLVTVSMLVLLPYIYFVFNFLSPINIIEKISGNAYRTVVGVKPSNVASARRKVQSAVDELQDVGRGAIQQGDRSIAMGTVNALADLVFGYAEIRDRLPVEWFEMSELVADDPDFVALAAQSIEEIRNQGLWLETKIFRRFLSLLTQASGNSRDVANLIGIHSQRIAVALGSKRPELLTLCVRAFNSYLRATINAHDPRTAYYLMNQYRMVADHLIDTDQNDAALEIAGYFHDYGQLAHGMGTSFLLETAAHDLGQLVERAVRSDSPLIDALLECVLELDQEIKEEYHEESLLGVRRTQIQLATLFLQLGQEDRARRIADDLKGERLERLERLRAEMLVDDRDQFWELIDRGHNFGYLAPDRREFLEPLFVWLRGETG
ncbi:MAG: DUF2254 domain-containing protein [Gammaproteobacteria bacterium]|nr:DUF2254 domain-containing protein [Gammaproteobacteria bacterium]